MQSTEIIITPGFPEEQRGEVAALFWQAFERKLTFAMRPKEKALAFLAEAVDPNYAISAQTPEGLVLGVAGFKTAQGAFVGGTLAGMQRGYGWFGGLWRGLLLSLLERPVAKGVLLMDGIMVSAEARGQGLGTRLLDAIKNEALARDCHAVRLDVIDGNPRARALYERRGFVATGEMSLGPLSGIFGFQKATEMRCELRAAPV